MASFNLAYKLILTCRINFYTKKTNSDIFALGPGPGEGARTCFGLMLGRKCHFFGGECPNNNGLIFSVKCPSFSLVLGKCPSSGLLSEILFVLFQEFIFTQIHGCQIECMP